jgi:hypothetical protein
MTTPHLIALNIYYEARDYPEHWEAIANVWFNRLADPYATTTNIQRLLADNSAGWSNFVSSFYRGTSTPLDPLNLSADDIGIISVNFTGYDNSGARVGVDAARNSYPSSQYSGMLAFYHTDANRVNAQVCQMGCIVAAPGQNVANNLARRGALRIVTVLGTRTLIMNNGIFLPGPSLAPDSFCATCCRNNYP